MQAAIIPARGGSKRILLKNIRSFRGKPIIGYSIEAAKQSGCFDRIIVSTDHEEIATIARDFGAEVPFIRPAELCDDFTGTGPIIGHAIKWLQDKGEYYDYICCIYATAPFLAASDLQKGMEALHKDTEKSYAFSVARFSYPVQRGFTIDKENIIKPLQPECLPCRSQDLDEAYHDAGQFYWGTSNAFLMSQSVFSSQAIPVILPSYRVQDIDTVEDWIRAEFLHQAIEMNERADGSRQESGGPGRV